MPRYKYQCKSCLEIIERTTVIANRKELNGTTCQGCLDGEMILLTGAPQTVSGVRGTESVPEGFKDVLRNIKKQSGKDCTIDV